jgi:hypothetical protein
MTTIAAARAKEAPRAGVGKVALASLVGTTIEFYDFSSAVFQVIDKARLR